MAYGVALRVVARLDQDAARLVHELDVPRQRRRDHRHTHRQQLVDHVGDALVDAGHQQQVAAAVPARHLLRGRVPGDHLPHPELGRPLADLLLQVPGADDVEHELAAPVAG